MKRALGVLLADRSLDFLYFRAVLGVNREFGVRIFAQAPSGLLLANNRNLRDKVRAGLAGNPGRRFAARNCAPLRRRGLKIAWRRQNYQA
jgi:hypothetical protein